MTDDVPVLKGIVAASRRGWVLRDDHWNQAMLIQFYDDGARDYTQGWYHQRFVIEEPAVLETVREWKAKQEKVAAAKKAEEERLARESRRQAWSSPYAGSWRSNWKW